MNQGCNAKRVHTNQSNSTAPKTTLFKEKRAALGALGMEAITNTRGVGKGGAGGAAAPSPFTKGEHSPPTFAFHVQFVSVNAERKHHFGSYL